MSQEPRDTLLEINDILTDWRNYTINDEGALKKVCEALRAIESSNTVNIEPEEAFRIVRAHAEAVAVRKIQKAHAQEQEDNSMVLLTQMRTDAEATHKRLKDLYDAAATFHYWSLDSTPPHPNPPPAL